jgi:thioesterase domain-containing protein
MPTSVSSTSIQRSARFEQCPAFFWTTHVIDLTAFEAECRSDIPLLNAMQLSFIDYEDLSLTMEAPLAPNINNKGTAFGGSIASICLFSGWAVSTLAFKDNGIDNTEIVVWKNEMTFERPARGLLRVVARPVRDEFNACLARLQANDPERIRMTILVDLFHDEERCATMEGTYVVWMK